MTHSERDKKQETRTRETSDNFVFGIFFYWFNCSVNYTFDSLRKGRFRRRFLAWLCLVG